MKRFLFILIFAVFLFGFWQNVKAVDVLIDYPTIEGAQSPNETSDLPQLINYIYKFALLACGIVALISILIGAIQYVTSAGNASKAGDAKDRISQALLGILILLAAVLILRTINPDLVNISFELPAIEQLQNLPSANFYCYSCCHYWLQNKCNEPFLTSSAYSCQAIGKQDPYAAIIMCREVARKTCPNSLTLIHRDFFKSTQPCSIK